MERVGRLTQITPAAEPDPSWRGWLSYIAEASDLLAGILHEERVMALVAQLVVPRLAVWCAVFAYLGRLYGQRWWGLGDNTEAAGG